MPREAQLAHDRRAQAPDRVEEAGGAGAVVERPRLDGAAEGRPLLQEERAEPGLREVGRRDQAVVAAADDDRVVAGGGLDAAIYATFPFFAFRSSSAASRPFAAMIPPPGWVDEPAIQ